MGYCKEDLHSVQSPSVAHSLVRSLLLSNCSAESDQGERQLAEELISLCLSLTVREKECLSAWGFMYRNYLLHYSFVSVYFLSFSGC